MLLYYNFLRYLVRAGPKCRNRSANMNYLQWRQKRERQNDDSTKKVKDLPYYLCFIPQKIFKL